MSKMSTRMKAVVNIAPTYENLSNCDKMILALKDANLRDNMNAANELIMKLKLAFINFKSLPPGGNDSETAKEERLIARETYEIAVFLGAKQRDRSMFSRHVAQLRSYYFDERLAKALPESPNKLPILGLNLLYLLVENRLADFHSELELMTCEDRLNPYVLFPIQLEQFLMVGSYNQVLKARERVPHEYYSYFLESLVDTVREAIADCMSVAYESMNVTDVFDMLMLNDSKNAMKELLDFISAYQPSWKVIQGKVMLQKDAGAKLTSEIPSMRVLTETLSYATELERIV